jgi:hypothetical protein
VAEEVILGSDTEEEDGSENKEATLVTEPDSETKAVAEKEGEEEVANKDKDSPADKSEGAPEKYEAFEAPEGFAFNPEKLEQATSIFKELGLSQEKAQKLIAFEINRQTEETTNLQRLWETTTKEWREAASNDTELGGANLEASVITAKAGIKAFGSGEFKDMLEATGVGDHPEMLRFLVNIGKAVQDDKILHGKASNAGDSTQAQKLFPDMN